MNCKFAVMAVALIMVTACNESGTGSASDGSRVTGTAGSTARMVISGDYLYAIAGSSVQLLTITDPGTPLPFTQVEIDWDIQTLFPYGDFLLVGAADGVHILDNTTPAAPEYVGDFQHATAVDPVVAQNDIAYVTLRRDTSQPGQGIANQMNIVDISDVTQPVLIDTLSMQAPEGLSVRNDRLYVCDGIAGLKTFDISDPIVPVIDNIVPGVACSDVIATDNQLYVIDDLGLSQYDTTTGKPLLMSTIETEPVIYVVER